jgi:CubicO group peptidase (beta-lactamase class C family)
MTIRRADRHLRRVMAAVLALTVAAVGAAAAQSSLPDTPEAFGAALKNWAARHKVAQALVVVRRDGRIVHRSSVGGIDPKAPVHLASLSKAITGACIATLIRDGRLAFDTPVASALAKFIARHGRLSDPRFARVTVAQLLTHRAGFGTKGNDPGSGPALVQYLKTNTATARPNPAFLGWALNQQLSSDPGAKFVYSNTGYLALGAVIEEATGAQYAPYCRDAVLAPAGVAGELEPSWRVMWSYGGWRMTGDDYLTFLDLFAAEDQRLGGAAKSWMLDPTSKAAGGAFWYGLGTYLIKAEHGVTVRHFGSWAYNMRGARDGTLRTSFLTFAARQGDGTAWFVYVTPRVAQEGKPGEELARDLLAAYRAVRKWN